MAAVTTSEFAETKGLADAPPFSLIEAKGLMARLGEELARAAKEFLSDPRAFIRGLFLAETRDAKRRRRIYVGLACAFVFHIALILVIAVAGWHYVTVNASQTTEVVTWVPLTNLDIPETARPEKLIGNGGGGGGGGDQNALQPATRGATPQMAPVPQIVKPLAPTVPEPSLPLPSTIVGPESPPVPANVQLGIMNGAIDAPPSPGPGSGDGLGGGRGSGAGPGDGPGAGPGSGGGRDGKGGKAGSPDGTSSVPTPIDFRISQKPPGFTNFAWIYRPRPIVTPEAQDKKVNGEVLLRATFHADGRITDIEVMRPIEYMTESAVESLRKSKFRPATVNGRPVTLLNVYIKVRVNAGDFQ